MSNVEFNEEEPAVLYTRIAKSNQPPGIVAWVASLLGTSQHVAAVIVIVCALAAIIVAFLLPSLVLENNQLIDPQAEAVDA